jgi:hypothetical protein
MHEGEDPDGHLTGIEETDESVIDHECRVSKYGAGYLAGMCEAFVAFMVKNASIKGSSAPSMTAATLPDSWLVR